MPCCTRNATAVGGVGASTATERKIAPPAPVPNVRDAIDVLAMGNATCIALHSGPPRCFGQLPPVTMGAMRQVSTAGGEIVGLDATGHLWINGERAPRGLPPGKQLAATCVIRDGQVWCSENKFKSSEHPVVRKGCIADAVEISGDRDVCVRRLSGRIACMRHDNLAAYGAPEQVPVIDDAIAIDAGTNRACVVRADRSVWCWDRDAQPVRVAGVSDAVSVAAGHPMGDRRGAACAVRRDGTVVCWGANDRGQLGSGAPFEREPVVVPGVTDAVEVSVGWTHACARLRSGGVACWGSTDHGETGTLATHRVRTPRAVAW